MHAVVRTYSGQGAKELLDVLEKNKADIERLIRGINGFISFSLARTHDGGFTGSVFQDKTGTDEEHLGSHGNGSPRTQEQLGLPRPQ